MEIEIRPVELPPVAHYAPPPNVAEHLVWLKRESTRHNLTRVPEEDWLVRHVFDSLVPAFAGWEVGARFLDLGTGAGFPGIPLAARYPQADFTLLEKKKKTVRLLNEFLGVSSMSSRGAAVAERAESLARDPHHRGGYGVVVVRALASLPILVELGVPFLETGGELWVWKSDLNELEPSENALSELRARVVRALCYRLPGEANDRYLIALRKESITPDQYPRRPGTPERHPL